MKIKVWYSDETTNEYESIEEARIGIFETVVGSNFSATVDSVAEVEGDTVIKLLYCE